MATPNSPLIICNMSLDLLKQDEISALDQTGGEVGRLCARWFDSRRRAVLRRHTWNFATKRTQLAEHAEAPTFNYTTQYALPSDFIRLVGIGELEQLTDYQIENNFLLCNESGSLSFRYIYNHTNLSQWDPLAIEVLILDNAIFLAPKVGQASMVEGLRDMLAETLLDAHAIDGQEAPPRRVQRSKLRTARRGMRTRRADILE